MLLLYRSNKINKNASIGAHGDPKGKKRVTQEVLMICRQLHAFNNWICNSSQNCTWLYLVQLLDCYLYNYSLITLKCM